jgi:hypothetical protein
MAGADFVNLILSPISILFNEVLQLIFNTLNIAKQKR